MSLGQCSSPRAPSPAPWSHRSDRFMAAWRLLGGRAGPGLWCV